jgi:hypothetical protein
MLQRLTDGLLVFYEHSAELSHSPHLVWATGAYENAIEVHPNP